MADDRPPVTGPAALLHSWLEASGRNRGEVESWSMEELVQEVETQLEELQVAKEELRVQQGELESALDLAHRERRRYEELFRNAPIPYLTTNAVGKMRDVNRAASELLGRPPASVLGKPITVYLGGRSELRARLNRLARLEPVEEWETELDPKTGRAIPVRVSATAFPGLVPESLEVRWVLRDLRGEREERDRVRELHRHEAEKAALQRVARRSRFLSEAGARLMGVLDADEVWATTASIIRAVPAAVLFLAPDEETVQVVGVGGSAEARRRLEPLVGNSYRVDTDAVEPFGFPLRRLGFALGNGQSEVLHDAAGEHPGGGGPCLIVPIPSSGHPYGAMAIWLEPGASIGEELLVGRNLAERVGVALDTANLFRELTAARRAAEEAQTAEADFLAVVSHELRTPLTAIVSYGELLGDAANELPERLARYARRMANAAEHQHQLVEQVLAYKRVQQGVDDVTITDIDFCETARFAAGLVRPQVADKDVELKLDCPTVPITGRCDAGRLRQILANLLGNAVRHTDAGQVRLKLGTEQQWVVLEVEDTGEGIADEELPRIFDRFWHGRSTEVGRHGSGLGLTITLGLVKQLHGTIDVESARGVGTTFTVRIPRVPPDER